MGRYVHPGMFLSQPGMEMFASCARYKGLTTPSDRLRWKGTDTWCWAQVVVSMESAIMSLLCKENLMPTSNRRVCCQPQASRLHLSEACLLSKIPWLLIVIASDTCVWSHSHGEL